MWFYFSVGIMLLEIALVLFGGIFMCFMKGKQRRAYDRNSSVEEKNSLMEDPEQKFLD